MPLYCKTTLRNMFTTPVNMYTTHPSRHVQSHCKLRRRRLHVCGLLCQRHLLLALAHLLRLLLLLRLLAVEVGGESPEREHERDALRPVELLVEEDDGEDLRERQEHGDHDAGEQRRRAGDEPHDAQVEQLPRHGVPGEDEVVVGRAEPERRRFPRHRLEVALDRHAEHAHRRARRAHHRLHLHHRRVGGRHPRRGPRAAPVPRRGDLDERDHQPGERRRADGLAEPRPVRPGGLPRRLPRRRPDAQHRRADGEQHDGVGRERREPEAHEEEREHGGEGQLRRQQQRRRGQRQRLRPQRVHEARHGVQPAEHGGGADEAPREEEVADPVPAAAVERHAQRRQQQRPAGDLERGGQPQPGPAVHEVDAEEERPAGAEEDEARAEYDQQRRPGPRRRRRIAAAGGRPLASRHRLAGLFHGCRSSTGSGTSSSNGGHDQMKQC
uniref:Uncharacterized protein n=1 Tax=Oryza glumipatula TaxID=40148 RepID=A0A0D9Z357_9ORYZ